MSKPKGIRGRLVLGSGERVPFAVVYAAQRDLTALIKGTPELSKRVRAKVKYGDGLFDLLVNVGELRRGATETGAALEALTIYTAAGRPSLVSFLRDALGIGKPVPEQFVDKKGGGTFYLFDPKDVPKRKRTRAASKPAPVANNSADGDGRLEYSPAGEPLERRWRRRVAVDLPARLEQGGSSVDVKVVEVSERGVRAEGDEPEQLKALDRFKPLRLFISFPSGRLEIRAHLSCNVAWIWFGDTEQPCRIGLQIQEVHDGVHGQQWARFVEASATEGMVAPSHGKGKPMPRELAAQIQDS